MMRKHGTRFKKGDQAASSKSTRWIAQRDATSAPKFVIPRKKQETTLFQEISLDSREYVNDVFPILKRQCFRPPQHQDVLNFHYTKCTLVNNESLLSKFEEKRREMRQAKLDAMISYGFWQVFSDEEVTSICGSGLSSNYVQGTLGKPDLGVYVSQYADVPTAAPLLDGVVGTLIVFKILRGRVKLVPAHTSGHLEPSINYECHAPKSIKTDLGSTTSSAEQTPYHTFGLSLLYLYDFVDVDLQTPPRHVCPIAVIEYAYEDKVTAPHWLRSELKAWTGALRFDDGLGDDFERNLHLVSHLAKMKPPQLGQHLLVRKFVKSDSCLQWAPLFELRSGALQGTLFKQRRDLRLTSGHFISFYRLMQTRRSEKYQALVAAMRKHDVVGLASLPNGTALFIFPASHFSCQLGIPVLRDAQCYSLYVLIVAFKSLVTGTGYVRDPYEFAAVDCAPSDTCILNPAHVMARRLVPSGETAHPEQSTIRSPVTPADPRSGSTPKDMNSPTTTEALKSPRDPLSRDPRLQKRMAAAAKGAASQGASSTIPTASLPVISTSATIPVVKTAMGLVGMKGSETPAGHPSQNVSSASAVSSTTMSTTMSTASSTTMSTTSSTTSSTSNAAVSSSSFLGDVKDERPTTSRPRITSAFTLITID